MNQEIQNWSKKVIEKVTPILEKYDLDFYPFQAPLNIDSKILILGLNPAGYFNKNIRHTSFNNFLTSADIFSGNSEYKNRKKWKIYNNLMKLNYINELNDNFNYMNYVYFPTPKFHDIKEIKDFDIIDICKNLTLELISILNPEVVIVLGTATGIDIISKNTKTILNGYKKRLLVQGEIGNIKAFGIPHPSYNNYKEEYEEINKVLELLLNEKSVIPYSLSSLAKTKAKTIKRRDFDIKKINANLKEFGFSFSEFKNKKNIFQAVYKGINNDILDFRLDTSKKYFSFRSNDKINNSLFELQGKEIYRNLFEENAELEKDSWLVYKSFKNYNSEKSIEEQISNDLKILLGTIKEPLKKWN